MLFGFMFDVLPNVLFMCKCGSFWTKWQWTLFTIGSDMPTLNIASDELRMIWNVLLLHSLKLICSMKDIKWWKGACLLLQVTYHFFHWKKGTPFAEDQGIYNRLTWWEQIDNGKQLTRNRKFLTVVPVVL